MNGRNLILIGMPGSGKSTLGKMLAFELRREFLDSDALIEKEQGCTVAEIFAGQGEVQFRKLEKEMIKKLSLLKNKIIATGGGSLIDPENLQNLQKNGRFYYLKRDLELLSQKGRPLSSSKEAIEKLFNSRKEVYQNAADCIIDNNAAPEIALQKILEDFHENFGN